VEKERTFEATDALAGGTSRPYTRAMGERKERATENMVYRAAVFWCEWR
jgi:uncharacterized protein YbjQ (UPF0145 family)